MTDARVSTTKVDIIILQPPGNLRVSTVKAQALLQQPSDLNGFLRVSDLKTDVDIDAPKSVLRTSDLKVEVLITLVRPYLQDMYGHFVHSLHGSSVIRPIRSLKPNP